MSPTNNKLICLIHSFSAKEIEQFKKFILSPYFTKGRNYMPFLEHILELKNNPVRNNIAVDTGELKTFSKQTLRNRYSELYKLGEEFLIFKGLESKKAEKDKILLEKLMEKKLYSSYNIKFRDTFKHLNHEKYHSNKLQNLNRVTEVNSVYLAAKNKVDLLYNEYYNYTINNLCLSLITNFETGLEFRQQEFHNRKYEPNYVTDFLRKLDIQDMMKIFRKSDSVIYKVTSMNYYLYKAFENDSAENNYFESHEIFTELFDELEDRYKTRLFQSMINFCIRKQNQGNVRYKEELFKLYNEKLNQNLILDLTNNVYLFNHFRDYVYIGIELKKYDWVEKFITKYSPVLPPEIKDDETKISYAKLNFAKEKYTKSLLDLENIKKTHYLLYLDSSVLKLSNYYELKIYEEAFLELDKLGHYLRNHKEIPKDQKEYSSNFISFYKKLLNIKLEPGKKETSFLDKELNEIKFISRREWLKEKLAELIN